MTSKTLALAFVSAAAALVLSGCGREGELQRPRPLVGGPTQPSADQRTSRDAAARARADTARAERQAPQSAQEVRGLEGSEGPPPNAYEHAVTGAPQGPDQPPPYPGVLPDPLRPSTVPQ